MSNLAFESTEHEVGEKKSMRIIEIVNSSGEKMCQVKIEAGDEINEDGDCLVTDFELQYFGSEFGVKLSELVDLSKIKIYFSSKREVGKSYYNNKTKEIFSVFPKNASDVATILHELGHAQQMQEVGWQKVNAFSGLKVSMFTPDDFENIFGILAIMEKYQAIGILSEEAKLESQDILKKHQEFRSSLTALEIENKLQVDGARRLEHQFTWQHVGFTASDLVRWQVEYDQAQTSPDQEKVVTEMRSAGLLIDKTEVIDEENPDEQSHRQLAFEQFGKIAARLIHQKSGETLVDGFDVMIDFSEDHPETAIAQLIFFDLETESEVLLPITFKVASEEIKAFQDQDAEFRQKDETLLEKIAVIEDKIKLLKEEIETWFIGNEADLVEEFKRPRRLEERDATRRALVWMRKLKQDFDIDLLQDVFTEPSLDEFVPGCLGVTNGPAELKKALVTYGATSKQMKRGKLKPKLPEKLQKVA